MTPLSRRDFLKMAAVTGVVVSLGGCSLLSSSPKLPDASHCEAAGSAPDTEFDYIVIGSGAGGGPVAANLALAGYRVLLLEAGGEAENAHYSVPAFTLFRLKTLTSNGTILSGITPTTVVKARIRSETRTESFGIREPARSEAARRTMP